MRTVSKLFTITAALVLLAGCTNKADDQPTTQIFEGTAVISLTLPLNGQGLAASGGSFVYYAPSEVKYLVFGLFNQPITVSGKTITNPSAFVFGSRDGLANFVRGTQTTATMHAYNQSTKDFDAGTSAPGAGTYHWAVWGYDQYGNLTHSSPSRSVTLP